MWYKQNVYIEDGIVTLERFNTAGALVLLTAAALKPFKQRHRLWRRPPMPVRPQSLLPPQSPPAQAAPISQKAAIEATDGRYVSSERRYRRQQYATISQTPVRRLTPHQWKKPAYRPTT